MLKRGAPIARANTSIQSRSILQILIHRSRAEGPNNRLRRVHIVMGCWRGAALRRSYNQHADHVGQVSSLFLHIGIITSDRPVQKPKPTKPATHPASLTRIAAIGRSRSGKQRLALPIWVPPVFDSPKGIPGFIPREQARVHTVPLCVGCCGGV